MKRILLILCASFASMHADPLTELRDAREARNAFARELPRRYIEIAVHEFNHRNGKVIVEIGSSRIPMAHSLNEACIKDIACLEGHSTIWWALTGAAVYSVDISAASTQVTKEMCKDFANVTVVNGDGIAFLQNFEGPIDLLFLDAWDVGTIGYTQKHLEAYLVAKKNLHDGSIILIDDTDIDNGGKGRLVIAQAIKDGYRVVLTGRQTMLMK